MKEKILHLLKESGDCFLSGQDISNILDVSRTAIWKYINQLKLDGYNIEAVSNKGYRIISSPDILSAEEIKPYLNTELIGQNIIYYNTLESTNTLAKRLGDSSEISGTVVLAEEQTNGRGRLGRNWVSPFGKGIWMSILLRPNINPVEAVNLTQTAAAAIVLATEELGIDTLIKWPNDIVINSKKVSGILTEMNAELTRINYVVVGIGINANIEKDEFPIELHETATSLKIETGCIVNRRALTAGILNNFEKLYFQLIKEHNPSASINICREKSAVIGKKVLILANEKKLEAQVLDIDPHGQLVVQYEDGTRENILSGEVSIRGKDAYI